MCVSLSLCLSSGWKEVAHPVAWEREGGEKIRRRDWTTRWVIHCWTALTAALRKLPSRTCHSWNIHQDLSLLNIDAVCCMYAVWGQYSSVCMRVYMCVWHTRTLLCVSLKSHCTLLGNVWHVLCFVYQAWNEAVSSFILFKYLSPSRRESRPVLGNLSFICSPSKLGLLHTHTHKDFFGNFWAVAIQGSWYEQRFLFRFGWEPKQFTQDHSETIVSSLRESNDGIYPRLQSML